MLQVPQRVGEFAAEGGLDHFVFSSLLGLSIRFSTESPCETTARRSWASILQDECHRKIGGEAKVKALEHRIHRKYQVLGGYHDAHEVDEQRDGIVYIFDRFT